MFRSLSRPYRLLCSIPLLTLASALSAQAVPIDVTNNALVTSSGTTSNINATTRRLGDFGNSGGGIWVNQKQQLAYGFDILFQYQIPNINTLSTFSVIIQDDPDATAQSLVVAGSGAFGGITRSLAVEWDLFVSGSGSFGPMEVIGLAVHSLGVDANHPNPSTVVNGKTAGMIAVSDASVVTGAVHQAKISYVPGSLNVFVDDMITPKLSLAANLQSLHGTDNILDVLGRAYVGFAAHSANGSVDISNLNITLVAPPTIPIPEPGTSTLFAVGLAALGCFRRRRAAPSASTAGG